MTVVGVGFRAAATAASLENALNAALAQAGRPIALTALATAWDKALAPVLLRFAAERGLPVIAIAAEALHLQRSSASVQVPARYGQHSLAESSALAAAGPGAQLLGPRCVSLDRMATAAIAIPENTAL